MVRVPNPFRRSRGSQSGGTTPASSTAVSAGPSTPRKLSSHALNAFTGGEAATADTAAFGGTSPTAEGVAGGGGGGGMDDIVAAADTGRAAPWGASPYEGAAAASAAAATSLSDVDRRHQPHYGLLSAKISQAKQREQYRQQHAGDHHLPPAAAAGAAGTRAGAAAAAVAAPGEGRKAGVSDELVDQTLQAFGLDTSRFTAGDQDGPACSVLMPAGVTGGSLAAPAPPMVVSEIPAAPLTQERPAPRHLPDFMEAPGEPRLTATPDKFHPGGHPLTPPEGSLTSLQQHFAFFDIDKDGEITLGECITGFRFLLRRLLPEPLNTLAAVPVALAVQLPLCWLTSDTWLPDLGMRVHVRNAHKVIHGSNSRAWDNEGRFTPARFEAVLSKYDRDGKGGLTFWEVVHFLRGQANLGDVLGVLASSGEWLMTWALLRDATGVLRREEIRGMYDGTAFYRLAELNGYKHYGLQTARAPAVEKGYA